MEKDGIALPTEKNGTDEMKNGKSAMFIYGSWALESFKEAGLNYGVVEIPAFANAGHDSVSILSSSGVSISKDSKHKEEAWEFVKYWTGEEMNKARIGYELPVLNSVVESEATRRHALRPRDGQSLERVWSWLWSGSTIRAH